MSVNTVQACLRSYPIFRLKTLVQNSQRGDKEKVKTEIYGYGYNLEGRDFYGIKSYGKSICP